MNAACDANRLCASWVFFELTFSVRVAFFHPAFFVAGDDCGVAFDGEFFQLFVGVGSVRVDFAQ